LKRKRTGVRRRLATVRVAKKISTDAPNTEEERGDSGHQRSSGGNAESVKRDLSGIKVKSNRSATRALGRIRCLFNARALLREEKREKRIFGEGGYRSSRWTKMRRGGFRRSSGKSGRRLLRKRPDVETTVHHYCREARAGGYGHRSPKNHHVTRAFSTRKKIVHLGLGPLRGAQAK